MNKVLKVLRMREGGHVQRCHTVPHHGSYDVAQHTFGMLILLDELHPAPSEKLWRYILRHDLTERWIGDTPTCAKILMPGLRDSIREAEKKIEAATGIHLPRLGTEDRTWLKALDWLEFLLWCDEQIGMGYQALTPKRETVLVGLVAMQTPPEVDRFLEQYQYSRTSDELVE